MHQGDVGHLGPDPHLGGEKTFVNDRQFLSQGLFAAANIFSSLKLVYIFSVNPYLGPLQVKLLLHILQFCFLLNIFW